MYRFNMFVPDKLIDNYRDAADKAGVSVAEVLRRLMDFGYQETVMNSLFPSISGHIIRR